MTPGLRPFDDEQASLYTVGQVSEMLGVQPAFLRRLDSEAVVQPSRSDGGQRRYSRQEILRVEEVVTMTGQGLTLAGIRRLLALEAQVRDLQRQLGSRPAGGQSAQKTAIGRGVDVAEADEEMSPDQLASIRARLEEPPPLLALAERNHGRTALAEYIARLQQDRIALVDEVDRLRAEVERNEQSPGPGSELRGPAQN